MININSEEIKFAEEAAKHFEKHPHHRSYGLLEENSLLALKWGLDNDCVLVVEINEPKIFDNIIKKENTEGEEK